MKVSRWWTWSLVIMLSLPLLGASSPARKKTYPIPGHGTLELDLPAGLGDLLDQPAGDVPPAIALKADDGSYAVMVVVAWRDPADSDFGSADHLRRVLDQERAPYLKQVGATDAPVVNLTGGPNSGVAYLLVDKALVGKPPEPGNWPYMRQGVIKAGDLLLKYILMMYSMKPDPAPVVEGILMGATHRPEGKPK